MVEEQEHKALSSLKLTKNTRGYSWEIKVYHEDSTKQIEEVIYVDEMMQKKYGTDESTAGKILQA